MSVKYFVTFKDKKSRDSDVTSGRGKKPSIFCIFFLFLFFFCFFLLCDSKVHFITYEKL